jgi:PAS domain S-box-containing protein
MAEDPARPDWEDIRERFLGLDEDFSIKSYYPQLVERLRELEESREYLEQKSAALVNLLEDLEEERRKAKASEARLQSIFRNLPFGFWAADSEGRIDLVNEIARGRYGMEPGRRLADLPDAENSRADLLGSFESAAEGAVERRERKLEENGEVRWVQSFAAPIVVDGAVGGVLGADLDVTRHKRAEESLARLNEELESKVAERTARLEEIIAELRKAQDRLVLSEKLAALGRLTAGIAHDLNSPLGAIESSSLTLLEGAAPAAALLLGVFSSVDGDAAAAFLPLYSRAVAEAATLGDLGDRAKRRVLVKELEDRGVEGAESLAETVDELHAYDDFASLSARFGIGAARSMVEAANAAASLGRSASIVHNAAARAAAVVRALKSFEEGDGSAEAGGPLAEVDVDESLSSALELFRSKMRRGVDLELDLQARSLVKGERSSLGQVWINLLTNALQAMDYQGKLRVASSRVGDRVAVEITDSGCGIAPEHRALVFSPFFTTKPVGEGSGFGLVVAKRIVERSGGAIDYDSVPGRTTFRIELPFARYSEEP